MGPLLFQFTAATSEHRQQWNRGLKVTEALVWNSCTDIYIPSGLQSGLQHEFTKVTKGGQSSGA